MGLFSRDKSYTASQSGAATQSAAEVPGTLLQIVPHKENDGIVGTAQMLQSIHDVETQG